MGFTKFSFKLGEVDQRLCGHAVGGGLQEDLVEVEQPGGLVLTVTPSHIRCKAGASEGSGAAVSELSIDLVLGPANAPVKDSL